MRFSSIARVLTSRSVVESAVIVSSSGAEGSDMSSGSSFLARLPVFAFCVGMTNTQERVSGTLL